jgi:hypothetical protein
MATRRTSREIKRVAPDLAQKYLTWLENPALQRPINAHHISRLSEAFSVDVEVTGHIALARIKETNERAVPNGQHSMFATIEGGHKRLEFVVEKYVCDTREDYGLLFHCFDADNRQRSPQDSATAWLMGKHGQPEWADYTPTFIVKMRGGLEFWQRTRDGTVPTWMLKHLRLANLEHFKPTIRFIHETVTATENATWMNRAPIIAAMFEGYASNQKIARTFWPQVSSGNYKIADAPLSYPPKRLHRFLTTAVQTGGHAPAGGPQRLTAAQIFLACVRCWNAYTQYKEVKTLYTSTREGAGLPLMRTRMASRSSRDAGDGIWTVGT